MPVNEVEVLTAVGSGAFGEKVVQIKLDKMYGGTAFSLTYGASRNLINRWPAYGRPDGYDWGREWQTCWFEGIYQPGYNVYMWVNPTQACGNFGFVNNPVLSFLRRRDLPAYEGHRADVWGRSTIRYKEYSPPDGPGKEWGNYKKAYYQTIDYPNTHVLGTVEYTAGWHHRGPIRGGVTYPAATFYWDMYDERGQWVPLQFMDSILHLQVPDAQPAVFLGQYENVEGYNSPVNSNWMHLYLPDVNLTLSFSRHYIDIDGNFTYPDRLLGKKSSDTPNLYGIKWNSKYGNAVRLSGTLLIVFREGQATELWTD